MTPIYLHPQNVHEIAKALADSDLTIGLRSDLTWSEMDESEQRAFVDAARFVLEEASKR